MFGRGVRVSIFGALMISSGARAADGPQLQPVRPWVLDYAEAQCLASRDYGAAEKPVTLVIRPAPNGETYEIIVLRHSPAPQFAEELKGSVDFGSGPINAWLLHYRITSKKLDAYQFRITAAEMAQARAANSVALQIKGGPSFAFALQSIPGLLNGLSARTTDLQRYWNMGGIEGGNTSARPKGDIRAVFTSDDYPWEALSRNQEGKAQFLLPIDETGRVAACHVQVASGVPALDAMGCIAIQGRAKFTPARDRAASRSAVPSLRRRLSGK